MRKVRHRDAKGATRRGKRWALFHLFCVFFLVRILFITFAAAYAKIENRHAERI